MEYSKTKRRAQAKIKDTPKPRHTTVSAGPSMFHDDEHRAEARQMFSMLEPNFHDLSRPQLVYIASAITHPMLDLDTKIMIISMAQLAGPDLDRPVTDDELYTHMQSSLSQASDLLLNIWPAEGNA